MSVIDLPRPDYMRDEEILMFEDSARKFFAQHAHAGISYTIREQPLGHSLQNHQIAVLVYDQARQFIGFAETDSAGIVSVIEHDLASSNCPAQAGSQQNQPCRLVQGLTRNKP